MTDRIDAETRYNLLRAFRILFSPQDESTTLDQVLSLDLASLRNAFRRKALATHPDRASHLGQDRDILTERFKEITDSFETLYSFVEQHADPAGQAQPGRTVQPERKNTAREKRTRGVPPDHELMLGQYLYYTGRISYRTLLDAVYWQRNQRARYGSIARNWKIISSKDILSIMKLRKGKEKFGECAMRLGLIDSYQHNAIIKNQMCSQRPIGEYFVLHNIISSRDLETVLHGLNIHNHLVRMRRSAPCSR